ncbi:RNA polymerase III subunit C82 [Entomophthora muscae]|uniref:RNA polymerase III subunit C82 n=1 Tax=Entomophthora muscae TaxID=34485 RepID=A0ACC2S818_9FUNG|nr:RNA polymerase III subunit C82 [Entomophthora muscae]
MSVTSTNRLCKLIVSEQFGPIVEKVASTLLDRGRLNLRTLEDYAGVPLSQIKKSLFILLQHNLVTFYEVPAGNTFRTYYTLEVQSILDRANLLSTLSFAKERYGSAGLLVAKTLILNGKLKPSDIEYYVEDELKNFEFEEEPIKKSEETIPFSKKIKRETNEAEGAKQRVPLTLEHVRAALLKMIQTRFVSANYPKDMETKLDQVLTEDDKLRQHLGVQSSDAKFKTERAARDSRKAAAPKVTTIFGLNRDLADHGAFGKKRANFSEVVETVDGNTYFSLNFEHIKVMIRNTQIIEYATSRINQGAGATLRAFVSAVEPKTVGFSTEPSPSCSGLDLQNHYDRSIPLETFIHNRHSDSSGSHEPNMIFLLGEFLKILAQDEACFLTAVDDRTIGQFHMDYSQLRTNLGLRVLEEVIKKKFGAASWRVFRILYFNGLMNESQLAKLAILDHANARSRALELALHGLIDIQEIPRTALHAPKQTFYLFHVKIERSLKTILSFCRWGLGGLLKRRRWELASRAVLLKKTGT